MARRSPQAPPRVAEDGGLRTAVTVDMQFARGAPASPGQPDFEAMTHSTQAGFGQARGTRCA